jgi:hypothetical protein
MQYGVNEMTSIAHQKAEKTDRIMVALTKRFDRLNDDQRLGLVQGLVLSLGTRMTNKDLGVWMEIVERAEREHEQEEAG